MWFSKPDYVAPVTTPSTASVSYDGYTIGMTDDERVMLRLTSGYTTLMVTMNEDGVRRMIKLLEATLPEDEDDQSAPKSE